MSTLKKATLQEIKADASAAPIPGTEIEVQFNPASLKLDLANKVEGGDTRGRQSRQYLGKTSTTLAFDLHFDTADEGTTEAPVSVRTRTAAVERFVLPKGEGNTKQAPPKARFHWDELVIDGIIESVSIDFDLFASNGTPLRAKMGVSIKEQDAKYQLLQSGPGANQAGNATPPGSPGSGPGSTSAPPSDRSALALDGESAAEFAARMGLDPGAWRGIAAQLGGASSLSLQAGLSIDFSASLSVGAGIGMSAGIEVGADVDLGASFGLDASAGFALAAAGGVGAAIETVAAVKAERAASEARRSFGSAATPASPPTATPVPPPSVTPKPSMPSQSRTPLQRASSSASLSSGRTSAPPAPAPPVADPRATSFGFGVPLRPRAASAADLRASAAAGRVALRPRSVVAEVLTPGDPFTPPWTRLPGDRASRTKGKARPCGCRGGHAQGGCSCR